VGARKLLGWLARCQPTLRLPAASTAGDLLTREGLVKKRRPRRRHLHPGVVAPVTMHPNDIWTTDFKGQFRTGDKEYCYPLTVADLHSRFLLGCDALRSTKGREARPCFERLFREYGLPAAMRSDNGVPFASNGLHGLSQLNVWWMRLGIQHQRIRPASPQENGAHERMHRTLKRDATRPPAANCGVDPPMKTRCQGGSPPVGSRGG
jgi:putative transposase